MSDVIFTICKPLYYKAVDHWEDTLWMSSFQTGTSWPKEDGLWKEDIHNVSSQ